MTAGIADYVLDGLGERPLAGPLYLCLRRQFCINPPVGEFIPGVVDDTVHQIGQVQLVLAEVGFFILQPGQGQGILHKIAHQSAFATNSG